MRLFGKIHRVNRTWLVECEPHVVLRLKRVFQKVNKDQHGEVAISDTEENCRELLWFLDRFPMKVDDLRYLKRRAKAFVDHTERLSDIICGKYDPRGFEMALPPRQYQSVAAEVMLQGGSLLLADDLGLGKTAAAICMLTEPKTRPALVVTLTHLPQQWEREIHKFLPAMRVHLVKTGKPYDLTTTKHGRKTIEWPFPDVVVLNYHKLAGWSDVLAGKVRSVVFDEVQELRHASSGKYSAASHIANAAEFRVGLSATPIYNYGSEIYNVLGVLKPLALGTLDEFLREWCVQGFGEKASIKDPKAFGMYMREQGLMLRRTRKEVGRELPPLTRIVHHVEADTEALTKVESAASELARIILAQGGTQRGEKLRASEELSWMLRQATGIAKAPYVAEFVRMLMDSEDRVVLYGWHREVYTIWLERLKDFHPVLYTGSENASQKAASVERFLNGDARILIMSLRAGAGLDGLQGRVRTVVCGELDWSPGVHEQCLGRVHRDGQEEPVAAYFLVADEGSDPVVADVLGLKKQQIDGIRDPAGGLIEALDTGTGHITRLAQEYLRQHGGLPAPTPEAKEVA